MFTPSTFIASYSPTDRVIRLLDSVSNPVNVINVCKYQKVVVVNAFLNIYMDDNSDPIQIMFNSNADALSAITNFKNVINTLKPNCRPSSGSSGGAGSSGVSGSPIAITYIAFKALCSTSSLIPLQWYDVNDSTNLLMTAIIKVFRVQAITNNDRFVGGKIVGTSVDVKIDLTNDKINYYFDGDNNNLLINSDVNNIFLTNTTNCIFMNSNGSNLNFCSNVLVDNSYAQLTACNNAKVLNNSTVNMGNSSNFTIDDQSPGGITAGTYTDVNINRSGSIGKIGYTTNTVTTINTTTLQGYTSTVNQDYFFNTSVNSVNQSITLKHYWAQAQSIFKIRMTLGPNNHSNTITVIDFNTSATLYTIQQSEAYREAIFTFNTTTNSYVFSGFTQNLAMSGKTYQPTFTLGQTVFNFNSSPYYYPVTQPTEIEMYINGIKQSYGTDYYYNSGLGQLIYTETSYPLNPATEFVEFIIY